MTSLDEIIFSYETATQVNTIPIKEIVLYIKMPTGEIETIINPNVPEKIKYLKNAYTPDLVHKNCKDIQIVDWEFNLV